MKKRNLGLKFWVAAAVGAIGMGVVVAIVAGFLLGHFTGNSSSSSSTAVAMAPPAEETSGSEEPAEPEEVEPAESEETEPAEAEKAEPAEPEETAQAGAPNAEMGEEVFAENCATCHGESGHGGGGGPDLRTMPLAKSQEGAEGQVTNGGGGMPAFGGQLSEEEITNVAAYVVEDIVGGK